MDIKRQVVCKNLYAEAIWWSIPSGLGSVSLLIPVGPSWSFKTLFKSPAVWWSCWSVRFLSVFLSFVLSLSFFLCVCLSSFLPFLSSFPLSSLLLSQSFGIPAFLLPSLSLSLSCLISSGWWLTYPSENYENQLGWSIPIYGKIKVMFQSTNQPYFKFSDAPHCCHLFVSSRSTCSGWSGDGSDRDAGPVWGLCQAAQSSSSLTSVCLAVSIYLV